MNKTKKGQKFEMVSINRGLYDELLKLANYDNSTGKIRE